MNEDNESIIIELSPKKKIIILFSSLVLLLISIILWKQQNIDHNIVIAQNIIYNNLLYLKFFKFISHYGMGIISILYSLLIFLSYKKKELKQNKKLFLFIIFSFALGSIAGDLLKEIIDRARPVIELSGKIILKEVSDTSSFPSGHATKSMALALPFIILALNNNTTNKIFKFIIILLATLVCYSRIALQKHYLSDVLAGIAVALFFVFVTVWIANNTYKRRNMDENKLSVLNKKLGLIFLGLAVVLSFI